MDATIFKDLENRWRQAFKEYVALKQATETQVTSHQWTSAPRYDLRPLYFERYPGRGRVLSEPPKDASLLPHAYGFDDQDRVVLHRSYHPLYEPFETFYVYQPAMVEAITYSSQLGKPMPGAVERFFYEGERLISYAQFMLNGYGPGSAYFGDRSPDGILKRFGDMGLIRTGETYLYEGERLSKIQVYHSGLTPTAHTDEQIIRYDEAGKLRRIETSTGQVLYQKRERGETIKTLVERVKDLLLKAIPALVAAQNFQEPIYCLELAYQGGVSYFPPYIMVGLESWREKVIRKELDGMLQWMQNDTAMLIWSPAFGKPPILEITDPAVLEACNLLEHAIHNQRADARARQFLMELTQALMQLDWNQIAPVAPDFVIFPLDAELDDVSAILKKIATKDQYKTWKAKGWV